VRKAEEVDGGVDRHQRGRLEVADDGVQLDRGIAAVASAHTDSPIAMTFLMPPFVARSQSRDLG
jgi:hypothetical protein